MKKVIFFLVLLSMGNVAHTQYTYFDSVYSPTEGFGNTYQMQVLPYEDSLYLGFGIGWTPEGTGLIAKKINPIGNELSIDYSTVDFPFDGAADNNFIRLQNDSYFFLGLGHNECFDWYPILICLDPNFDTLWTAQYPSWVECGLGNSFASRNATELDNGNVLFVSIAAFGDMGASDQPDSLGLNFSQIDVNGNLISSMTKTYNDLGFSSKLVVQGVAEHEGNLLMWGQIAPVSFMDAQLFVIKTTMTGEMIDSYIWGNPNNCTEGPCAGYLRDDGKLIMIRRQFTSCT